MDRPTAQAPADARGRRSAAHADLVSLLTLSGPVVIARLGIMAMGLCDALVVGNYSARQLGYHALSWAPTSVVLTMAVGLLAGVQVMTARRIGEGRRDLTGAVLRRGLVYAFWLGIAATAVLLAAGPGLLQVLGLPKDLADGATAPLIVFSLSLPGYTLSVAATFWLEGLGKPGPAAWAMWAANVVNLAIDLVLVPGTFGLPALGAVGGAWATTGARTFLAVASLGYIALMPEAKALGVFRKAEPDRAAAIEQRRIGYGAGVSNFFEVASFASLNVIAGWIGALAVAGWTIVLNVASLVFMVPLGLATGAAVLVGRAYGARDPAGMNRAGAIAFVVTVTFGILVSLAIWPTAGLIAHAYTRDAAAIALAIPAVVLSCLFFPADCLQVVTAQALRARGDVWVPTLTHLTSYIAVMMPLAWYLAIPQGLGLVGIVWAVIAASFLSGGLLVGRFWLLSRRPL